MEALTRALMAAAEVGRLALLRIILHAMILLHALVQAAIGAALTVLLRAQVVPQASHGTAVTSLHALVLVALGARRVPLLILAIQPEAHALCVLLPTRGVVTPNPHVPVREPTGAAVAQARGVRRLLVLFVLLQTFGVVIRSQLALVQAVIGVLVLVAAARGALHHNAPRAIQPI